MTCPDEAGGYGNGRVSTRSQGSLLDHRLLGLSKSRVSTRSRGSLLDHR